MKMLKKIITNIKQSFVVIALQAICFILFASSAYALIYKPKSPNFVRGGKANNQSHLNEIRKFTECYEPRDFAFTFYENNSRPEEIDENNSTQNERTAYYSAVRLYDNPTQDDLTESEREAYFNNVLPVDGVSLASDIFGLSTATSATIQKSVCNSVRTVFNNGSDWQKPKIRVVYRAAFENHARDLAHGECAVIGLIRFCARYAAPGTHGNRTNETNQPRTLLCAYEDTWDAYDTDWSFSPNHHLSTDPDPSFVQQVFNTGILNQVVGITVGCVETPLAIGPPPWSNNEWSDVALPAPTLTYGANANFFEPTINLVFCQKNSGTFVPLPCRFEPNGEFKFRTPENNDTVLRYGRGNFALGVRQAFTVPVNPNAGREFKHVVSCSFKYHFVSIVNCNNGDHNDNSNNHNQVGQENTSNAEEVVFNVEFTASITKENPTKVCVTKTAVTSEETNNERVPTNVYIGCIDRPGYMPYPTVKFSTVEDNLNLYNKPEFEEQDGSGSVVIKNYRTKDYEKIKLEVSFAGDPYGKTIETEAVDFKYTPDGQDTPITEQIESQKYLQFFNAFDPDKINSKYKDSVLDFAKKLKMRCGYIHQVRFCIAPQGKFINTKETYADELDGDGKQNLADDTNMCLTDYVTAPKVIVRNSTPEILRNDKNASVSELLAESFYVHDLPIVTNNGYNTYITGDDAVIHNPEHLPVLVNGQKKLEQIPLQKPNSPSNSNHSIDEAWVYTPFIDQETGANLPIKYENGEINQVNYQNYLNNTRAIQEKIDNDPKFLVRALNPQELGLCNGPVRISTADQYMAVYDDSGDFTFRVLDHCKSLEIVALGAGSSAHIGPYELNGERVYVGFPGSPGALVVAQDVPVPDKSQEVKITVGKGGYSHFHNSGSNTLKDDGSEYAVGIGHIQGKGQTTTVAFGGRNIIVAPGGDRGGTQANANENCTEGGDCQNPLTPYEYEIRGYFGAHVSEYGEKAHFPVYDANENFVRYELSQQSDIQCHGDGIIDSDPSMDSIYKWKYKEKFPGKKGDYLPNTPKSSAHGVGGCVHVSVERNAEDSEKSGIDLSTMKAGRGGNGYVSIKCSQWQSGVIVE